MIVGVVSSAIAAFFYVRVIVLMFFTDPIPDGPEVAVPSVFTGTAVALGVVATLVLGIVPQPVLTWPAMRRISCSSADTAARGPCAARGRPPGRAAGAPARALVGGLLGAGAERAYSKIRGVRACR